MVRNPGTRISAARLVLLITAALPLACEDASRRTTTTRPAAAETGDADYISALATANVFCHAWRDHNYAAGRPMLTVRLIRQYPDARLRDAVAGSRNVRHAAFEISGGRRLGPGRYAFKVRLFYRFTGEVDDRIEHLDAEMVLVLGSKGSWMVDDFPIPKNAVTLDRPTG